MTRQDLVIRLRNFGDDEREILIFDSATSRYLCFDDLDVNFDSEQNSILLG